MPGCRHGEHGLVGLVRIDEERRAAADRDAVEPQVRQRRAGQHDAGPVVAGKGDQALDRTGCDDHGACADDPQPLAQAAEAGRFRGRQFLERAEDAMAIGADDGGARRQRTLSARCEFRAACREPRLPALIEQRSAAGDHVPHRASMTRSPLRRKRARGGKTGGAGADHEHLGVIVHGLARRAAVGDGCAQPAESRGAPDQRLVAALPGPARRHEGLVVEAGRQETGR